MNDLYDISNFPILPPEIKDCIAPNAVHWNRPLFYTVSPLCDHSVSEVSVNMLPSEYQFLVEY